MRPPEPVPEHGDEMSITPEMERKVGVDLTTLTALVLLESVRGFGPQKFRALHGAGLKPSDVLTDTRLLPFTGRTVERFREAILALGPEDGARARGRAARQIVRAAKYDARILTYASPDYPPSVLESNNAVPVLYAHGDLELLRDRRAVACVGSRQIRKPYDWLHHEFARLAAAADYTIVSGFAMGADTIGHRAAAEANGRTILVMPCGLDRPFPPENRDLWEQLLQYRGATVLSEFPFGTAASALTLRKRNKMIVSLASAVLISQSSEKGGAMNAFRFSVEQRKPVATFAPDGTPATSGNWLIATPSEQTRLDAATTEALFTVFPDRPEPQTWSQWLSQVSS
jgi:DNA protecting protein DprA